MCYSGFNQADKKTLALHVPKLVVRDIRTVDHLNGY